MKLVLINKDLKGIIIAKDFNLKIYGNDYLFYHNSMMLNTSYILSLSISDDNFYIFDHLTPFKQQSMKRIFKLFIKEHLNKIEKSPVVSYSRITIRFNEWVRSAKTKENINRFSFKAHTTKHVIRKWCIEMGIEERGV